MSMLETHAGALIDKIPSYHEFLLRYSTTGKVIYGFVEGKDDLCFYRGFVEHSIPEDWEIEMWSANGKDNVYQIYKDIDWRRFSKKRVCFFVDRDLSKLTMEKLPSDTNIYVTDGYSIENSIVNRGTCRTILIDIFRFYNANHREIDSVCDLFKTEFESFLEAMIPVMSWILLWRRNGEKGNLNDIKMDKIFSVDNGCLRFDLSPENLTNTNKYIHQSAGVSYDSSINISVHQTEFSKRSIYKKYTRGKYVLWFLLAFCSSVHKGTASLFPSYKEPPKMNMTISATNAMTIVGNRARVPQSLRRFLNDNFRKYIEKKVA